MAPRMDNQANPMTKEEVNQHHIAVVQRFLTQNWRLVLAVCGFIIALEIIFGAAALYKTATQNTKQANQTSTTSPSNELEPNAHKASLLLSADTPETTVGKTVTLTITLDTDDAKTDGTTAIVLYDPKLLQFQSVENGTLYSSYIKPVIDTKSGRVTITAITDLKSYYNGKGVFAKLLFTTKGKGQAQIGFDFTKGNSKTSAVAASKQDILATATGTSVSIK